MAQDLNQVPPGLEVWEINGIRVLVRVVDEFGGTPMVFYWEITGGPEEEQALNITRADRVFSSWADFYKTGAIAQGSTRELVNTTVDPVEQILSEYEKQIQIKPWLADPEILGYWTAAALEGRSITDAELQTTEWWQTHSDAQRNWLSVVNGDPATADQIVSDRRIAVAQMMQAEGINNASADLVNTIADNWTIGDWSQAYAQNQIRLLSDPNLTGDLDPQLTQYRTDTLDTSQGEEGTVQNLINQWLGPYGAQGWTQDNIAAWASRLRNDPDAQLQLVELLKRQKNGLFPEFADMPNLTYDDIATTARSVFMKMWGEIPNETDPFFLKIVRTNDVNTAEQLLRQKGLEDGRANIANDLLSSLGQITGGQVRHPNAAVL